MLEQSIPLLFAVCKNIFNKDYSKHFCITDNRTAVLIYTLGAETAEGGICAGYTISTPHCDNENMQRNLPAFP